MTKRTSSDAPMAMYGFRRPQRLIVKSLSIPTVGWIRTAIERVMKPWMAM